MGKITWKQFSDQAINSKMFPSSKIHEIVKLMQFIYSTAELQFPETVKMVFKT